MAIDKIKFTSETVSVSQDKINKNFEELDLNKVDVDGSKVLSDNNYSNEDKEKLAGIEAGAEVNIINSISRNGVGLPVDENGNANVEVPTNLSELNNDKDFVDKTYVDNNAGKIDTISVNGINQTINNKNVNLEVVEKKPNGTNDLISENKITSTYLPDYLLGQLLYGGNVTAGGVATLSENAKSKLGTTSVTITLTNNNTNITGYTSNEGIYYILTTAGTLFGIDFGIGDWLISNGSAWTKIDNTDAVTGVKGSNENSYRSGNINITASNVGAVSFIEEQGLTNAQSIVALNNIDAVGRKQYSTNGSEQGEIFNSSTNTADGLHSHSEGLSNSANAPCSHVEGQGCTANGTNSHVGGSASETTGNNTFAHGDHVKASVADQFAVGRYNESNSKNAFEVGRGDSTTRRNIFEVENGGAIGVGNGVIKKIGQSYGVVIPEGLTSNKTMITIEEYDFDINANWSGLVDGYYTLTIPSKRYPIKCFKYVTNYEKAEILADLSFDGTNIYLKTDTKFAGIILAI